MEVDVPEEFTEAGRYEARFIGNDIDSELDIIEDKHAPIISTFSTGYFMLSVIIYEIFFAFFSPHRT